MTTVLLLGAGGSAAANVLDALRRAAARYRVVGADASATKLHLSGADHRVVTPRAAEEEYAAAVIAAAERYACDVVHPQPDPDVLAVGRIRSEIPAATYLPSQAALETAADKLTCMDRLRAAGV